MTPRKAAVLLLVLLLGTCNQAIMVAPSGSSMFIEANPRFIAAHGDVSVISVQIIKPSGQPVADGTVVQFFTSLGRIDAQGKTNDGVARVNLVSDSRSGTATVTASSGGDVATPSSTTTTVAAAPPVVPTGFVSAMSVTGASAVSAAMVSKSIDVTIGSALPALIVVSADPPHISTGRSATILAQVFDKNGNPVANAPVIFTIDPVCAPLPCSPSTERLANGGQAVFTDNNGRATDTLRTTSITTKTVTIHVTVPGAAGSTPGSITVTIN